MEKFTVQRDNAKVASATSKTRSRITPTPVLTNIVFIDPKLREEKRLIAWHKELRDYLSTHTEEIQDIALGFSQLLLQGYKKFKVGKPESSEVIQFPAIKNIKLRRLNK